MKGLLNDRGFKRIYIIGAGFSAPLKMPLAKDMLKEIYNVSLKKPWFIEKKRSRYGQAEWLLKELNYYFPLDNFTHKGILDNRYDSKFDIEKFLSYACAISAFGEQWDEHGDKFISFLKRWVAEAIFKRQAQSFDSSLPVEYLTQR